MYVYVVYYTVVLDTKIMWHSIRYRICAHTNARAYIQTSRKGREGVLYTIYLNIQQNALSFSFSPFHPFNTVNSITFLAYVYILCVYVSVRLAHVCIGVSFFFVVCFFQVLNFSFCFLVLVIVCSFGTNGSSPMQKLTDTIYQWERDKVAKQTEVQMDKNIVENKWIKWKIK